MLGPLLGVGARNQGLLKHTNKDISNQYFERLTRLVSFELLTT